MPEWLDDMRTVCGEHGEAQAKAVAEQTSEFNWQLAAAVICGDKLRHAECHGYVYERDGGHYCVKCKQMVVAQDVEHLV